MLVARFPSQVREADIDRVELKAETRLAGPRDRDLIVATVWLKKPLSHTACTSVASTQDGII